MKALIVAALAAGVAFAGQASADEALAKAKGCLGCHAVDKKVVGPAYKEVAAKYKGKGQDATLVKHVLEGSTGVWGPVPMPANKAMVSEAEAKKLVAWVLTQ